MKKNKIFSMGVALALGAGVAITSCVDTDSNLVDLGPDLDSPNDTVYSLLGVLGKMQAVADRTIILGEVKGDMTALTDAATTDLQDIANFTATADNRYNVPEDYYAIIQNCNYYIAHADTNMSLRGEKVFIREYAAVKAIRAWTYLQLAINYGQVPFYTQPLMTEAEADPSLYPKYDVKQIADYFIPDLAPYLETDLPLAGGGGHSASFIPVRLILGDLCLWGGRYREAAQYYHDYLTHVDAPRTTSERSRIQWTNDDFTSKSISGLYSPGYLVAIEMEGQEFDGTVSYLDDIFSSTDDNNYYYQASVSPALRELSRSQRYVREVTADVAGINTPIDTISPNVVDFANRSDEYGDLRYSVTLSTTKVDMGDNYAETRLSNAKINTSNISLYRLNSVYLRMAEAYNRAGFPESAFFILKYGLSNATINGTETFKGINQGERERAGDLLTWNQYNFISYGMDGTENTWGIHSVGCGDTRCDVEYAIPDDLGSREDSILFVEDLICDEMALEQTFDGLRFGDLQRIALRRGDPAFLADKVARRNGASEPRDEDLYSRLLDKNNWYLPLE